MKLQIKLDGKIKSFTISDGIDGLGGQNVYVDNTQYRGCYIENRNALDGDINFTIKHVKRDLDTSIIFVIDDPRYDKLKQIHSLDFQAIQKINENDYINTILFGFQYEDIQAIRNGYRFGKELTFNNFCITFNANKVVAFKSSHNGFVAPNYIEIDKSKPEILKQLHEAITKALHKYFWE